MEHAKNNENDMETLHKQEQIAVVKLQKEREERQNIFDQLQKYKKKCAQLEVQVNLNRGMDRELHIENSTNRIRQTQDNPVQANEGNQREANNHNHTIREQNEQNQTNKRHVPPENLIKSTPK